MQNYRAVFSLRSCNGRQTLVYSSRMAIRSKMSSLSARGGVVIIRLSSRAKARDLRQISPLVETRISRCARNDMRDLNGGIEVSIEQGKEAPLPRKRSPVRQQKTGFPFSREYSLALRSPLTMKAGPNRRRAVEVLSGADPWNKQGTGLAGMVFEAKTHRLRPEGLAPEHHLRRNDH